MDNKYMVYCENLVKIYKAKDIEVIALQGLDLEIEKGELMAIIGNSGSGKSTLLNMIGGLDRPSAGKLFVDGKDLIKATNNELRNYKRNTVGFVWQNNARNLIPYLTAVENIEMPMIISGQKNKKERAKKLLEMVGLSHKKNSKLSQLSGGEQQRIAIALALSNQPQLLLADEPTGAVDTKTSNHILDIFRTLNKEIGLTIIIVTHDRMLSKKVDRVVAIRDGRNSSEFIRKGSYLDDLKQINNESYDDDNSQMEFAVLDRVGRLQIPKEYLKSLGVQGKNRIKVELEDDKIVLINPNKYKTM